MGASGTIYAILTRILMMYVAAIRGFPGITNGLPALLEPTLRAMQRRLKARRSSTTEEYTDNE